MAQLPEELLEAIFANVQPKLSDQYWTSVSDENRILYNTLTAICRANRDCSRIATPMLYQTVQLQNASTLGLEASAPKPPLLLLLRACLQRPDLAQQIQRLKVQPPNIHSNPLSHKQRRRQGPLVPRELHDFWFDKIPLSENLRLQLLHALVDRDSEDAALAVLLFLARNLQQVEYTVGFPITKRCVLEVSERKLRHVFPELHTMAVSSADSPLRLSNLEPFFCISTLETVKAFNFHAHVSWNPTYPRCESVERLQLNQGGFTDQGLEQLFRCFSNLRELEISMIGTTLKVVHGHNAVLSPGEVADALRKYAPQLEKLHLDVRQTREEIEKSCARAGRMGPLGDVRSLERLRELTITVHALLDHDTYSAEGCAHLPLSETFSAGLEKLRVTEYPLLSVTERTGAAARDAHRQRHWVVLCERVALMCRDNRMSGLRCVEMQRPPVVSADEEDVWCLGWTREVRGDWVVLTRA